MLLSHNELIELIERGVIENAKPDAVLPARSPRLALRVAGRGDARRHGMARVRMDGRGCA